MDFKRDVWRGKLKKIQNEQISKVRRFSAVHKGSLILLGCISGLVTVTGVWFGTGYLSDPEVNEVAILQQAPYVRKNIVVNSDAAKDKEDGKSDLSASVGGSTTFGGWDNLCGYYWGDYPLELYTLSTAGERGCSDKHILECVGDYGQAYGLMQLDYRYDLVPFMKDSYSSNPEAWQGFAQFQGYAPEDPRLVNNQAIIDAFNYCYLNYPEVYMEKQPNFFVQEYLYNDVVTAILDANGFKLEDHSVFVAAALMSCNINCGYVTGTKNFFRAGANNNMSDEELLNCVYVGWRMYRTAPKWGLTNHRLALDKTGEEGFALQLLHGDVEVTTFNNSATCTYGAGWDGPNAVRISKRK